MAKQKRAISGLTAAKCPSCRIILLRPVPRNSSLMHCPTCDSQYTVERSICSSSIAKSPVSSSINDQVVDKLPRTSSKKPSTGFTRALQETGSHADSKTWKQLSSRAPVRRHSFHCKDKDASANNSR